MSVSGSLRKSVRDRGNTWDVFPVSFRMGGNEDGRGVGERLAVDPNDNRVLFFGSRHEGLWKSTDCAATRMPFIPELSWMTSNARRRTVSYAR